jgi:para-nitrobenzyl esterase
VTTTTPTVRTSAGDVRGTVRDGVHAFLGIPYAAPPFGPRRFAAPQPAQPWDGVRDCTEFGPTVPKPPYTPPYDLLLPEPVIPGEDCLNLNVWTPDPGASGLPVFVWVHGGSFVNGSGAVPTYDGATFARDGVVCVTLNYRLGVEGFLQFDDGGAANRGLLDQVAALRWVQDNVAAFGGDPARVTVGGESAGAMSVGSLLAMPAAEGLFGQAVLQSGAGAHATTRGTAVRIAGHLAERLGREAGRTPTREELAAVPLPELVAAQQALGAEVALLPDPGRWGEVALNALAFEPVVDGEVLPDLPIRRIAAGSARGVRVLTGANRDEHRLFLVPNGVIDLITDEMLAPGAAAYGLDAAALEVYRAARPGATAGEVICDIGTDWYFRIPSLRVAEAQLALGGPAWVYEFSWPSPQFDGRLGACHALELGFTWDTVGLEAHGALSGTGAPQALADAMHGAWVRFVTAGDPGWPAYDLDRRPVQDFGEQVRLVEDPRGEERALWDGVR